jgi:hypothetical protein
LLGLDYRFLSSHLFFSFHRSLEFASPSSFIDLESLVHIFHAAIIASFFTTIYIIAYFLSHLHLSDG